MELCLRASKHVPIRLLCTGADPSSEGEPEGEAGSESPLNANLGSERKLARQLPFPTEVLPGSPLPPHRAPFAARPERWFHSNALAHRVNQLVGRGCASVVHLDDLALNRALPHSSPPIVAHHHKLEPELASALGRPWHEVARLRRLERRIVVRAAHHVTCSEEDAARLHKRHAGIVTTALPCGADIHAFAPAQHDSREAHRLLFLGSLDYEPNRRALKWILRVALPHWRHTRPDLVLSIVGGGNPGNDFDFRHPNIEHIGAVPDVVPHLHQSAALIAPLDVGGGSRVKLAEALAAGCPIVASPIAAEGLGLVDSEHLVLAHRGAPFLRAVERVLEDPDAARARARSGRALAQNELDWDALAERLVEVWSAVQRVDSKRNGVASASSSSRSLRMNAGTSSASR